MNTKPERSTYEEAVEQLEKAITKLHREAYTTLQSWMQFVLDYCKRHGCTWDSVMGNPVMVERLNIQWLRSRKPKRRQPTKNPR